MTEATIDEHVHRILRTMFEHGLFEDDPEPSAIPVEEHGETAREVAEGGITLLKNSNAVLPLDGRAARLRRRDRRRRQPAHAQGGASHVNPTYQVSLRRRDPRPRAGRRRRRVRAGHRPRRPDLDAAAARPPRRRRSSPSPAAGAGLQATYFSSTDLSGDPIMTRTERGVRFETSFLGGGPFFGSLYGSQLPQTPGNAGRRATPGRSPSRRPATTRSR